MRKVKFGGPGGQPSSTDRPRARMRHTAHSPSRLAGSSPAARQPAPVRSGRPQHASAAATSRSPGLGWCSRRSPPPRRGGLRSGCSAGPARSSRRSRRWSASSTSRGRAVGPRCASSAVCWSASRWGNCWSGTWAADRRRSACRWRSRHRWSRALSTNPLTVVQAGVTSLLTSQSRCPPHAPARPHSVPAERPRTTAFPSVHRRNGRPRRPGCGRVSGARNRSAR